MSAATTPLCERHAVLACLVSVWRSERRYDTAGNAHSDRQISAAGGCQRSRGLLHRLSHPDTALLLRRRVSMEARSTSQGAPRIDQIGSVWLSVSSDLRRRS